MPSARELRDAHATPSDLRGALDGAARWAAILALVAGAHALHAAWAYLVAAVLIGGLQHALVNLAHDAWHRLCFRSPRWNDRVGAWLYAYPIGVPFHHDRERHLRHHRLVGREEDPDWVNYTNRGRVPAARLQAFLLGRLLGSQLLTTARSVLLERRPPIAVEARSARASAAPDVRAELVRIALVQGVLLLGFAVLGRWWEYFVLWLGPLATFASFFIALRAFVEHSAERDEVAPEERLHDFSPGRVERFFLSPCDFHHHALHHAYPTVPHFRLASLRRALEGAGHSWPGAPAAGYLALLRSHLARIEAGDAAVRSPR